MNKLLYMVYKLCQLIYTSFYYYFMPFIATFLVWLLLLETGRTEAMAKYKAGKGDMK